MLSEKQKQILHLIEVFDDICKKNDIWYTLAVGSVLGAVRHNGFIPWDNDCDVYVKIDDLDRLRKCTIKSLPDNFKLFAWDKEEKYSPVFDRLTYKNIPQYDLHLDIFPLIGAPENISKRKMFVAQCAYSMKVLHCKHKEIIAVSKKRKNITRILKILTSIVPDFLIRKWYKYLEKKYDLKSSKYVYTICSGYGYKDCLPKELMFETILHPFEHLMLPIPRRFDEYLKILYNDYMTPRQTGYK